MTRLEARLERPTLHPTQPFSRVPDGETAPPKAVLRPRQKVLGWKVGLLRSRYPSNYPTLAANRPHLGLSGQQKHRNPILHPVGCNALVFDGSKRFHLTINQRVNTPRTCMDAGSRLFIFSSSCVTPLSASFKLFGTVSNVMDEDLFEERAGILEYDAGFTRAEAEARATAELSPGIEQGAA